MSSAGGRLFSSRREMALVGVWLAAVLTGSALLWRYSSAAGASGNVPTRWPAQSAVARAPGLPTLLMFAHPQCPCSRASLGQLAVIVSRAFRQVDVHVLFDKPSSEGDDWTSTDLWKSAAALPGVSVAADIDGAEAARFGAETSGWVVLYDAQGALRFAGGITRARGHAGDNVGTDAVIALLTGGTSTRERAPVFGCSLKNPELAGSDGGEDLGDREGGTWIPAQ